MKILAIGAHPDDIEVGCGGSLLGHRARHDRIAMLVMTTGERGPQASEPRVREQERAAAFLGARLFWGGFPDGAIPEGREAIEAIESVIHEVGADVVYAHSPGDTHQDHRATGWAAMAAARRSRRILLYESPTSVGFAPHLFVDINDTLEGKLQSVRIHTSQVLKNKLIDLEAIESQARYRGFEARARHAEAFAVARFVWDLGEPRSSADASSTQTSDAHLQEVR